MAVFSYKALDSKGKEIKGVIEAPTKSSAYNLLKNRGIYPLELHEEKTEGSKSFFLGVFRKTPTSSELAMFFRTLSTLLDSGIPLVDAVNSFTDGEEKKHLRIFYKKIVDSLKEGLSFTESLKKAGIKDPVILALVSSGERSSLLSKNLLMAADLLEKRESIKGKVLQALIYPSVLMIVAFGVIVFMLVTVIPKVEAIYTTAKLQLPFSTRLLLFISSFILNYYYLLLAFFIFFILFLLFVSRKKKQQLDFLKIKLPIIGKLLTYSELVKFFTTFGDLLSAGVPAVEAYRTAAETILNLELKTAFISNISNFEKGVPFYKILSKIEQIPGVVVQLIKAGENSGNLSKMSLRVAKFLENELNFKIKNLTSLLEPVTMLLVGIIVGFVVYALLLPILSISTIKIF